MCPSGKLDSSVQQGKTEDTQSIKDLLDYFGEYVTATQFAINGLN